MAEAAIRKLPIELAALLVEVLERHDRRLLDALTGAADPGIDDRVAVVQILVDELEARRSTDPASGDGTQLRSLLDRFVELWPLPPRQGGPPIPPFEAE